eukprot:Skav202594  [mRNA]  locus=scaffold1305:191105:195511:- [translate_table: standard]
MVKESHPDKGGSNEQTAELTSLRDSLLREPLRFQVFRPLAEQNVSPMGLYATSDCPLRDRVAARVRRPLHQNITGQWAGALQVRSSSGVEAGPCFVASFRGAIIDLSLTYHCIHSQVLY